jgi:hypothetical protein
MDLVLIETGNGGDLVLQGNDLAIATGYENIPYLSMFGGADWWGNEFLDPAQQFNSLTESALKQYALNSAGRVEIEKAINADLEYIAANVPGTKVSVVTTIVSDNRLSIVITIDGQTFSYLWNPITGFLTYVI